MRVLGHSLPVRVVLVLLAGPAGGCDGCDEGSQPPAPVPSADPAAPPAVEGAYGTVVGTVRLRAGAEVPLWAPGLVGEQPDRANRPESCTPPTEADRRPVVATESGALSGVLVSVADFEGPGPPHEAVAHELVIRDCRLSPMLVSATRGDSLVVRNETDYPFLPQLGRSPFMQALLQGQSRTFPLSEGGIQSVTCGFTAPCGRAEVFVLYHPVHGVTDAEGRFRLERVPAGAEITLGAWQSLFEPVSTRVVVEPGETLEVTLEIAPAPPPRADPAVGDDGEPPAAEGPAEDRPGLF